MPVPAGQDDKAKLTLRDGPRGGKLAPRFNGSIREDGTPVRPRGPDHQLFRAPIRRAIRLALADNNGEALKNFAAQVKRLCKIRRNDQAIAWARTLLLVDMTDEDQANSPAVRAQFILEAKEPEIKDSGSVEPVIEEIAGETMQSVEDEDE